MKKQNRSGMLWLLLVVLAGCNVLAGMEAPILDEGPPFTCSNDVLASCTVQEVVKIAAGSAHTCALLNDGSVKCWGINGGGQLGQEHTNNRGDGPGEMGQSLLAINLGTGKTASTIATRFGHTCALLNDETVKCWGDNFDGQLGQEDTNLRGGGPGQMGDNLSAINLGTGKTASAIVVGSFHTCALLNGGSVKCWGRNGFGQLGLGDPYNRGDGDVPGEMGDKLPAINLGTGKTAAAIAAGFIHTCALLNDGNVKCWGHNGFGQLGQGNNNGRGDEDFPDEMGDNLPAIDLGTGKTASAIAAGGAHTCALLNDGSVKCWGHNVYGQLGQGVDTNHRGDDMNEMGDKLPAINLGTDKTASVIAAGEAHTCALLNDGSVKCWGWNDAGQLGQGDNSQRGDGPNQMGDSLPAINLGTGKTASAIAAGELHTCALLNDGSVKCWGNNEQGQLGLGDTTNRGDKSNQMGDALPSVKLFSSVW